MKALTLHCELESIIHHKLMNKLMPHTLAIKYLCCILSRTERAFSRLASAEHCIVHRSQNNQRMAGGCGFEIWSKNVGADDESETVIMRTLC